MLTSIGHYAFDSCSSLVNVDLLHTNLQELGERVFWDCDELKSMTIPDSLQTLGESVFDGCLELVPSSIDVSEENENDVTSQVVLYLRSQQRIAELEKMLTERDTTIAERNAEVATLTTEVATLTTENAALKISNAPAHTNDFMSTIDFKRHFVGFVHIEMLLVLREVCKEWNEVVKEVVDESVKSGAMIVHDGEDISREETEAREETRELATQLIFLLNIAKVGKHACMYASNLVVLDIPEGVVSIGEGAFSSCWSLTAVYFPRTLISIGKAAFISCTNLDNVDLLHTNLQELGQIAFGGCFELKSMRIPDSLQTIRGLSIHVFENCYMLVPSSIDVSRWNGDATSKVIAHLHSQQLN